MSLNFFSVERSASLQVIQRVSDILDALVNREFLIALLCGACAFDRAFESSGQRGINSFALLLGKFPHGDEEITHFAATASVAFTKVDL